MHVEIAPLADGDIDAAGAAMARAHFDDPFTQYAIPDPVERARIGSRLFANSLRWARLAGVAYAPAGNPTGAICGWRMPVAEPAPEELVSIGFVPFSAILDPETSARVDAAIWPVEEHMKQLVPEPCWYLASLGVDPAHQGQGIGKALVRAFLDNAAPDGLPVCLWAANPENVAFYESLGMKEIANGIVEGVGLSYWICAAVSF